MARLFYQRGREQHFTNAFHLKGRDRMIRDIPLSFVDNAELGDPLVR